MEGAANPADHHSLSITEFVSNLMGAVHCLFDQFLCVLHYFCTGRKNLVNAQRFHYLPLLECGLVTVACVPRLRFKLAVDRVPTRIVRKYTLTAKKMRMSYYRGMRWVYRYFLSLEITLALVALIRQRLYFREQVHEDTIVTGKPVVFTTIVTVII